MNAYLGVFRKRNYPKKHLTFVGNRKVVANNMVCKRGWSWAHVDWALYDAHQRWQGIEYETIGDGIYRYLPKKTEETDEDT